MIALPTKTHSLWLLTTLLLAATLFATACSGADKRRDSTLNDHGPIAGAELWQDAELLLPADAPLIGVIRLQEVLTSAEDLLNWTIAEPQMFGTNGDAIVQTILAAWNGLISELGANPLDAAQWQAQGIDPARPLYVGFYPSSTGDAVAFIETIETILEDRLQLEPDETMLDAMLAILHDQDHEFWIGISAEISNAVKNLRPQSGMRLIIPVFDDAHLLESLNTLAAASHYETVTPNAGTDPNFPAGDHIYFNPDSPWPAFRVRIENGWATLDIVFKEFQLSASDPSDFLKYRERMLTDITNITRQFPAGRPAAPRPPLNAAVAVAFHQTETAKMARVRGYSRALESLRTLNANDRDQFFIELLIQAMENVRTWELARKNLPGTVYSATRDCHPSPTHTSESANCLLNLKMHLIGARSLPDPTTPPAQTIQGLDITERSLAAAIDLDPFFIKEWKQWIHVAMPEALLDGLEAITIDPILAALSIPRGVALMLANVEKLLLQDFEAENLQDYDPLIAPLRYVQRIELASINLDTSSPDWYARLAIMLHLRTDSTPEQHIEVLNAVHTLITDLALDISVEINHDAPTPFIFLTRGLTPDEAARQLQLAQNPIATPHDSAPNVLYLRLEPLALMSLLTESRTHALDPIDLGILVQRLGPMILTIRPDTTRGIRTLLYNFELHAPPAL